MFNENLKKRMAKAAIGVTLLAPTVLGTVTSVSNAFVPVVSAETYNASDGTVTVKPDNTGQTDGTITLNGAKDTQSIKNKQFMFYKIFNVENAKNEESTNYTWNDKYKAVVQQVVFSKLSDTYKQNNKITKASDVSEYAAIDYIQSMNNHKVEGSKTEQQVEGRYSEFRYFTEDLKNAIRKAGIEGDLVKVTSPDSDNAIKVTGLSWGYYVVDEVSTGDAVGNGRTTSDAKVPATDNALLNDTNDEHTATSDGTHFASSLVLVNTVNNEAVITLKSDYPEIVKKIREDDNRDKIGLHKDGWNDLGDFEIGQTVPYENDVTIPDMNGYHGYYFAIEDRMDPALTFTADKSKMKLVITKKGGKSYTLKETDYNLQTIGSNVSKSVTEAAYAKNFTDANTTFGIEIEDLKAIVDREFANFNEDQENDYSGLSLHVEYEATLNDLAAENTGRPGFENDVRLIFSNNPDSTGTGFNKPTTPPGDQPHGKTPWDSVVAFTYRLNGLKVNTNNFALEDARFRIYEDEAMTKEVIVKKKATTTTVTETTSDVNMKSGAEKGESNPDGAKGTTTNIQDENTPKAKGVNEYVVVNKDSAKGVTGVDIVSDADGNFSIVGLDSGTYYLKEVKAPAGYRLLKDPVKLTVTATMNEDRDHYIKGDGATDKALKSFAGKAELTEFYHQIFKTGSTDLTADIEKGSLDATVVNETMEKLPVTGGQMMAMVMALGAGVVAFSVYAVTKKKEEPES